MISQRVRDMASLPLNRETDLQRVYREARTSNGKIQFIERQPKRKQPRSPFAKR